ncbi:Outer membrane protein assembly factor BamA [Buchnera aphidicola (Cinara cuneomaculata)]|uniref:Outer membrane protein assembly factor BamA n=1 Tax=Buchnera aphidicola (Cinara cuneomaculata) TaxID=1660040 RepID=A0A451CXP1_9GAMM|nr:outer membrane protein assembly factor BamA [Buchnera aphidicola]VFP78142.1 Outer membrane protein assembly factor BamA [Buchnera aphidicola (Cinara cuneomaculata)]
MLLKKIFFVCCLCFSMSVSAANIKHIKRISIRGIQNISANNILRTVQCNLVKDNTSINVSKTLSCLLKTNHFIHINTCKLNDTLVFSAQEHPIIRNISISGINDKQCKYYTALLRKFNIKKNRFFYIFNFKKFCWYLKKSYELNGYFNVYCTLKIIRYSNNTVQLKIMLHNGPELCISKIMVHDNKIFSKRKLLQNLPQYQDSLLWNFFEYHKYDSMSFKKSLHALYDFYTHNGYLDFKINKIKKCYSTNKKDINVKININEGSQYHIKKIFINTCDNLCVGVSVNDIKKNLLNMPYCTAVISQAKKDFKNLFLKKGLLNTRVLLHTELDKKNHVVFLYVVIDSKKQFFIKNIFFSGNYDIEHKFLNKFMYKHKNDFFDINLIKQACDSMFNTDLFNDLNVYATNKIYDNKVDVYFSFKENDNTRNINISTNYQKGRGLLLQLLLIEKNLFNTGNQLYVKMLRNVYDTRLKIHLLRPLSVFKNFFFKSHAFVNCIHEKYAVHNNYINKLFGCSTSIYTPTIKHKKFSILCGYEKVQIFCISPHVAALKYLASLPKDFFLNSQINNFRVNDFFIKYKFDFNNIRTKDFYKIGTHIKFIGKLMLPYSDNFYHKILFKINQYFPLENMYDLMVHNFLEFGSGLTLSKNAFPFYENYQFNKKTRKSGFRDNSIGPVAIYYKNSIQTVSDSKKHVVSKFYSSADSIGGNMMIHANSELLFPEVRILKKIFQLFQAGVFLDAVNIWDTNWKNNVALYSIKNAITNIKPDDIHLSAGTFIRLSSIFGPVTFTYAFPLYPYHLPRHCLNRFSSNFV